jgi:CRP-like cAMP-binding protein
MSANTNDPIIVSLRIPSERRTKRDLVPIIDFVRGLKFFHSFSEYPHTVEEIATYLELQRFENGDHVFNEGEPGDRFYIVLDGEISIIKRRKVHALIDFITENVVLVKLGCGKYFGETALESSEGLRTASAVATKPSILLTLTRHHYQTILFELKKLLRNTVRASLSAPSSLFHHFPSEYIERLAELVVIRSFSLHEEIYHAGNKLNSLMVVKSGMVKLVKAVSRTMMLSTFSELEDRYTEPKLKAIHHNSPSRSSRKQPVIADERGNQSSGRRVPFSSEISTNSSIKSSGHRVISDSGNNHHHTLNITSSSHPSDKPPGYWILTRADEFLDATRPTKVVTEDIHGLRHITEVIRGSVIPKPDEQIDFTVAVLMPGQALGEISILDSEQTTPVTALAATAVELYCFDCELLIEMGIMEDTRIMRSLLDDWKFRNPPSTEIFKALQKKYSWERRKMKIMNQFKNKSSK